MLTLRLKINCYKNKVGNPLVAKICVNNMVICVPKLTSASEELRGTTPLKKPMVKQNSYEGLALPGIISVI